MARLEQGPTDLKAWREARLLSQRQAADDLGIARSSLILYETGAKPLPRVVRLAMLGLEQETKA